MGRSPRSSDKGLQKGSWTAAEDKILIDFIKAHGEGKWSRVMKETGLRRCGKSCRLRWLNYLRPDIKRGNISSDEEELIIRLHKLLGNRWSLIAGRLPGRTDNEIKNYWNTNLGKKVPEVQLSHFRGFSREPPISKTTHSQDHPAPPQSQEAATVPIPPGSNSSSPTLSLSSTDEDDLMADFNLDGEEIRQILESDFTGINQSYIDGLLSPEPELEVDDYLSMFEEQDFQNRFTSCVPSADKISANGCLDGDDMTGGSDFVPLFEGHGKWPDLEV